MMAAYPTPSWTMQSSRTRPICTPIAVRAVKLVVTRVECGLPTFPPTATLTPLTITPTPTPTFTTTPTPTLNPCNNPALWRTETPMTVPRAYLSGAVVNNQFYAIGGVN